VSEGEGEAVFLLCGMCVLCACTAAGVIVGKGPCCLHIYQDSNKQAGDVCTQVVVEHCFVGTALIC